MIFFNKGAIAMKETQNLLVQYEWRVIDQSVTGLHIPTLQSFGIDDCLCASVGAGLSPATARAWVHDRTVVLGIQDTKLPFLKESVAYLKSQGYQPIVRNSGGLAVILDEGILNLSLILPEKEKGIDINRGYDTMVALIEEMFPEAGGQIIAREIVGSYCPGSYDLSIDGRKFAGISQRRLRHGVAVQIYLCVNGSGSERAELIRQFYELGKKDVETKLIYPQINIDVMASLSELLGFELKISDVMLRFLQVLHSKTSRLSMGSFSTEEIPLLESYYERVVERNNRVFSEIN